MGAGWGQGLEYGLKPKICEKIGSAWHSSHGFWMFGGWILWRIAAETWITWGGQRESRFVARQIHQLISWSNLQYSPVFFTSQLMTGWWFQTWLDFDFPIFSIYFIENRDVILRNPLTKSIIFQDGHHIAPPSSWCLWISRLPWISWDQCEHLRTTTLDDQEPGGRSKSHGQLHSACFGGAFWREGVGGCFGSRLLVLVKYVITNYKCMGNIGEPRDQREMWHIRTRTWKLVNQNMPRNQLASSPDTSLCCQINL